MSGKVKMNQRATADSTVEFIAGDGAESLQTTLVNANIYFTNMQPNSRVFLPTVGTYYMYIIKRFSLFMLRKLDTLP